MLKNHRLAKSISSVSWSEFSDSLNTSANGMDATLYVSDVLKQVPRRVYADTLIVN